MRASGRVLFGLALVSFMGVSSAVAQPASRRMEVGGNASVQHLSRSDATNAGIGGRFSFDLTKWAAAEAEMTFYPNDDIIVRSVVADFGLAHYRRRTDGFFGVKVGRRGEKFGLFAKIRPGFTHLTHKKMGCIGEDCARILMLSLFLRDEYRTEFAMDLGGGFEFYPTRRTVARIDLGDTMIRHRSFAPPCWNNTCTSHNFATRVGGGVRF